MTSEGTSQKPVAIVTGAARRIGRAIAGALHARGLSVLVHYRSSADQARALVDELNRARPGSAAAFSADLADESAPQAICRAALDAFGRIDVLVNNVSIFRPTPVAGANTDDWNQLMTVNLRAPFMLSKLCAQALATRRGSIVNIVDIYGLVPLDDHSIYSQSKAGLIAQTRSLARELAPGVRVNAVAPGAILWPENDMDDEQRRRILDRVALRRTGRPEDISGAVAFLALDAPYITGQILAVDGGRLLNM